MTDPRIDHSCLSEWLDIVVVAIAAVAAGPDSGDDMEDSGNADHNSLMAGLARPNGFPSHDTFRRRFERFDSDGLEKSFLGWVEALHEAARRRVVTLDSKSFHPFFDEVNDHLPWSERPGRVVDEQGSHSPGRKSRQFRTDGAPDR